MGKLYTISQAAKLSNTTVATLHHYDRINLLKPFKVDKNTGYRYYSDRDLLYIKVINFYKNKNTSLEAIKGIFSNDNFNYIIDFLSESEEEIDLEINRLKEMKLEIAELKKQYIKQNSKSRLPLSSRNFYKKKIDRRAIVKIEGLSTPTIENFNKMMPCLYKKIADRPRDQFEFDNSINILSNQSSSTFFATAIKFPINSGEISYLPAGKYLYAYCRREELDTTVDNLMEESYKKYKVIPDFIVKRIIFTGIFNWIYEVQICLDSIDGRL